MTTPVSRSAAMLAAAAALVAVIAAVAAGGAAAAAPPAAPAASPAVALPSVSPGTTIPGPAGPDQPTVEIDITTFEPAAPEPGDRLVIEGTVTNRTDEPMVNVQALLRHNLNPLSATTELALVDTDPRLVWGSRPGHVYGEVAGSLPARQSAGFRMEVQLETACPQPEPGATPCVQIQHPGVYVFGVDVREGNPNLPGARVDAGTTLTLVPWLAGGAERSVDVAMLWPVSGAPAIMPDGTLGEEDAGAMLGPVGWLSALVDAPDEAPVTWVIDPDLLDTVASLADGGGGSAAAAESWLTTLDSATDSADLWLLPYAVPDVGSFDDPARTQLAGAAAQLTADAARELAPGTDTLSWPIGGTDLAGELAAYREAGVPTAVVASDAVGTGAGPWVTLSAAGGEVTGLVLATTLSSAISTAGESTALRQRWLAATALAVLEDPDAEPTPLVASPPLGWQPTHEAAASLIQVWMTTPWVQPVALEQISAEPVPATLLPAAAAPGTEPAATAEAAAGLLDRVGQYEALLADPAGGTDFDTTKVRAASAAWRTDPEAGRAYISAATAEVRGLLSRVSVQVASTVTLSSNTGAFPVNVINELDVPVTVRLELESANPQRMSVEPVTAQRIEPGETEIVRVTAEAVANGKVRVDLQLATVDGTPLGRATQTVVNATDYGVIGWFLIVGAGVLFAAGLALRTIRGKRRNGTPEPSGAQPSDHAPLEGASR